MHAGWNSYASRRALLAKERAELDAERRKDREAFEAEVLTRLETLTNQQQQNRDSISELRGMTATFVSLGASIVDRERPADQEETP